MVVVSSVVVNMSMSLDGVVGAAEPDQWWPVHERVLGWVFDLASWRANIGMEGGEDNADSRLLAELDDRIGAYVMGRAMFDFGEEPWGEEPPFHAPVVVVTHRDREALERVGTTFSFETGGIEAAVKQARALADGRDVQISGGASLARQALAAGVVDELNLHVSPVIVGDGLRILDGPGAADLVLEPVRAETFDRVTHLRYRVGTS